MKQAPLVKESRQLERERIAEVDLNSLSEEQLQALYEELFGEPSDEEIAEAVRQAALEYEAGDYSPTSLDDDDDEPYRQPTRREILEGIKQGYKEALAGDVLTAEQFRSLLSE